LAIPSALVASAAVTRPIFEGMGPVSKAVFYAVAAVSTAVFAWGAWHRARKYRMGRAAGRGPAVRAALSRRLHDMAKGTSVSRGNRATGLAHFFILWGFLVAFMATVILTFDTDVVRGVSRLITGHEDSFFHGTFFIAFTFVVDTMGFAFLVALVYMAVRRGLQRPWRLGYDRADSPAGGYSRKRLVEGDWVFLSLLLAILVTAYVLTGLRILGQGMPWFSVFSPFGRAVAEALSGAGLRPSQAVTVHGVVWWAHAGLALAFVAYIPYSKAMHMLVDAVNVLATDRTATLCLPGPPSGTGHPGYREIPDFTWKELLDLDACTKCGRCHEVCPARTGGAPLSPRDLVLDLRQWVDTSTGGRTLLDRERRPAPVGPLAGAGVRIAGDVIDADALWSCTTCMHCVDICPAGIEHVPTIVQMRRSLVDEGAMGPTLQQALQNLAAQGNSFGRSARTRARWARDLGFAVPDARKQAVKYLWFVGDYASFDERLQDNSRALAGVLHTAGVDFGLLYEAERNAGNDVRRVGEEGLFEMLAEQNIAQCPTPRVPGVGGDLPSPPLHRAPGPAAGERRHRRKASRLPGHLPRPVLPGPLQQRHRCASARPAGAWLRTGRDAASRRGQLLLRGRWWPDLDGRQPPHGTPEPQQGGRGAPPGRGPLRRRLPEGHDDVLRCRQDRPGGGQDRRPGHHPARPGGDAAMTTVNHCNLPEDLYYVVGKHVWARREGDLVTVGMTDVAQHMAKTIVAVTPKAPGKTVQKGRNIATVESGKWVGPVPAPVSGEIVAVNDALAATPSLVNSDPYGAGWVARLRPSDWDTDVVDLASGPEGIEAYRQFLDAQGITCG